MGSPGGISSRPLTGAEMGTPGVKTWQALPWFLPGPLVKPQPLGSPSARWELSLMELWLVTLRKAVWSDE